MITIPYDDLESAFHWVSGTAPFENSAYISKTTGQVFMASSTYDMDDELPEDCDDPSLYWTVPHKNDLDLGRSLAYDFTEQRIPTLFRSVEQMFHRRGAYRQFKDMLDRNGLLDDWHEFERLATETALLAWAKRAGMNVKPPVPKGAA